MLAAGIATLGTVLSTAYADILTESFAYPAGAPGTYATTNWSTGHTFSGFNALMSASHKTGTLTSVAVKLTEGLKGTAYVVNTAQSTWDGSATLTNTVTLSPIPGTSNSAFVTVSASTPSLSIAANTRSATYNLNNTNNKTYNYTSNLNAFLSSFDATVSDSGLQSCSGTGGNGTCVFTDSGYATALVTYNYTPTDSVPAPPALALFAAGLLGLGGVKRFRTRD